jgi:glucosylceramidase
MGNAADPSRPPSLDHMPADGAGVPVYQFVDGDFWGRQIGEDLENWVSGWIYWNMILDHKGGPPLVDTRHKNPEYNVQHPIVIINTETKEVTYTGTYYYLAHFSRFVRPGAVRIATSGGCNGVKILAFKNQNGEKVLCAEAAIMNGLLELVRQK